MCVLCVCVCSYADLLNAHVSCILDLLNKDFIMQIFLSFFFLASLSSQRESLHRSLGFPFTRERIRDERMWLYLQAYSQQKCIAVHKITASFSFGNGVESCETFRSSVRTRNVIYQVSSLTQELTSGLEDNVRAHELF